VSRRGAVVNGAEEKDGGAGRGRRTAFRRPAGGEGNRAELSAGRGPGAADPRSGTEADSRHL